MKSNAKGNAVSGAARATPLAKNWTLATEPSGSAAAAVSVVAVPTGTEAPAAGAVNATVGLDPLRGTTVTATPALGTSLPSASRATAVSTAGPMPAGVQLKL